MSELTVGAQLLSLHDHKIRNDFVSWVGGYRVKVDESLPDVLAGYPVRIRKNAIAEQIPCADLLVTASHEIFIDNLFIPIRRLVNGVSIYFDTDYTSYVARSFALRETIIVVVNGIALKAKS
ncbi:Hint domain-containing protein [Asaia krungthepensis]|uniref:Hint domain-containing protein n=1 Tax=Asaia krungthepensis TaxID=220990 RepID=UPI00222F7D53|nr:Hint domain-containing protein [Asaia krungthepensis]